MSRRSGYHSLGKLAKVLLRIFYYNALGAYFDALIQRTDGCTNVPWCRLTTAFTVHINCTQIAIGTNTLYFVTLARLRRTSANVQTRQSLHCQHMRF